jgi:GT2 family glycosyltransferase
MKTAVILCSVNRPQVLHDTVVSLGKQAVPPIAVILSLSGVSSALPQTLDIPSVLTVYGPLGLTKQRNAALRALPAAAEYVLFMDDDAELAPNYLASMEDLFDRRNDVVIASGVCAIDGLRIARPLGREEAVAAVEKYPTESKTESSEGAPGCNIFVRRGAVESERFDERLPLSGWLEDYDFSVRCRRHGAIVCNLGTCTAHLAMQRAARERGFLVGYSQIANSYYLWQKGTISSFGKLVIAFWLPALRINLRAVLRGAILWNSPHNMILDHPGRVSGNVRALLDAALLRLRPERLLDFA